MHSHMPAAATIRRLSIADAAYIAGLVDGEGTITLTRQHANEGRRLVVSISNNERALLEFVLQRTGVGKITSKRNYGVGHGRSFAYQVSSRQALELLRRIAPCLRGYKRLRAHLALRRYIAVTPRNGRYSPILRRARTAFEARFFAIVAQDRA